MPTAAAEPAVRPTVVRGDIQGLRALAVSMVVIYHLWPSRFTGGFVGVDVFFVISGFLITSHLLAHPPRTPRDLAQFWSRRIRRLLPASLLVLAATLIATRIVAPATYWQNTAVQAKAAALYVVNWRLAHDSVDYLASTNAPTPVQHFWSLSVEEQFYLGWPILILILASAATLLRRSARPVVFAGLAVVVVASFAYSVHKTHADPAAAYFVTPTRVWELGAGGLLAAAVSTARTSGRRRAEPGGRDSALLVARIVLGWAGIAAVLWAGFRYTGGTPFPGWQAAVPVLGTVAVIGARTPGLVWSPGGVLGTPPARWLGDVSYSVYLWHWPLIVLVPFVSGNHRGALDDIAIIVTSLVLAALTKPLIEDRFRAPRWGRPLVKPYLLAVVGMAIVVVGAQLQTAEVHHRQDVAAAAVKHALAHPTACFGSAALSAPAGACPVDNSGTLTPTPIEAATDKSDAYDLHNGKDCFAPQPAYGLRTCQFGDTSSTVDVALVGNSHAGQWLPALEVVARKEHWHITTYLASRCAWAETPQTFDTSGETQACLSWTKQVEARLAAGHYDLVVMTNRISVSSVGQSFAGSNPAYERGYEAVLRKLQAVQQRVVAIHDTPAPGFSVPDCLAAHSSDHSACDGTRTKWLRADPVVDAVQALHDPRIVSADLTDHICDGDHCAAAVGGVPVYFDESHMTATYSATLGPYLDPVLVRALHAS